MKSICQTSFFYFFFSFCPLSFPGGSDDKESAWEYSPKIVEE